MIRLLLGDALKRMKKIEDGSVDMILTDPPYGINYQSNRRVVKKKFDKIKNDSNLDWLDIFFENCYRIQKNNTAIYCFCSWHNIDKFKISFEKFFKLKNILVWVKNNHGSGDLKCSYAPKHEFILYGNKGKSIFREKRYSDIFEFDKISSSKLLHPNEKNVDMLSIYIKNNSDENQIILDPFMGSGTTGVACKNLNRNFIGIEQDETYFKIAKARINKEDPAITAGSSPGDL